MELTNCLLRRGASTGPCSVRICGSFARLTAPNFQQTLAIDCGIDTRHQGRFTEFHDAKSGMTLLVGTEHIPLERQLTELWVSLRGAGEYPSEPRIPFPLPSHCIQYPRFLHSPNKTHPQNAGLVHGEDGTAVRGGGDHRAPTGRARSESRDGEEAARGAFRLK
ncbi:hypothetical protein SS50377_20540 [Spironucleus salmonicida]|uniref:Uncharacterized protein n=1 Tax=Spironucleus salmonicida TaxID=348837 RepID=V6LJD1_9EUKA|nr:hypothetical protein SS50377_20526 [Spironucleus salmonicida]KAH0577189.1 hypothetical protein SS50377_20540 [Spironucleus salmonicida]|eukprot:EST43816.1 Hypothetical protein SS50377_16437 [Spironucleus salmonicida]